MPIPDRKTLPTGSSLYTIQITDDGSRTLIRNDSGNAFHSGCGAISETRHVYLKSSGVAARLRDGLSTTVLEIGLGTGMAMMMTVDLAARHDTSLHYVALETQWLSAGLIRMLEPESWVDDSSVVENYLLFRDSIAAPTTDKEYRWKVSDQIAVEIGLADVNEWEPESTQAFDAIYFDPFAPESAPKLWEVPCLTKMRRLLKPGGMLSTYSCSRKVRDAMEEAGFQCRRIPGPVGGKREILVAN